MRRSVRPWAPDVASAVRMNVRELQEPIEIDGRQVHEVELRKPRLPDLLGLKLYRILELDASEVAKLLPRITTPPLDPSALAKLDPADVMDLAIRCQLFFVKAKQMEGTALTLDQAAEEAEETSPD